MMKSQLTVLCFVAHFPIFVMPEWRSPNKNSLRGDARKSCNKSAINLCSLDASDRRFNLLVLPRVHWWNGDKLVCCRSYTYAYLAALTWFFTVNRWWIPSYLNVMACRYLWKNTNFTRMTESLKIHERSDTNHGGWTVKHTSLNLSVDNHWDQCQVCHW